MPQTRRRPSERRRRALKVMSMAATGAAVLGTLAFALVLFLSPARRGADAPSDATVVRIDMSGWQPSELEAESGTPLPITMVNLDNRFHTDGGGWHNFVIPSLDFEVRVPPKGTETFSVPALEAGSYEFYCDVCCGGKDNPFMQGTLHVS